MKPDFHLLVEKLWGVAYVAEPGARGRWLYVSPRIEHLLGFTQKEWQDNAELWAQRLHPEDVDRVLEEESSLTEGTAGIEYRLRRKSGDFIWVSDEALVTGAGERLLWYGVISDITDRKDAEEARLKSEERYRALVQNAPDGITVVGPDGAVIYSSPANARIFGRAAGETDGGSVFENLHPDDIEKAHAAFKALVDKPGLILPIVLRIKHSDGDWRWLEINATSMIDSPAVGGIVVNFRDFTKRKELEDELRESRTRFEAQYRGIPVPTYTWKIQADDFVLIDCNIAAQNMTDGKVNELFGSRASSLYRDSPDIIADFRSCGRTKESVHRDTDYVMRSTGQRKHLSITCAFVPPDLIMVHTLDVTDQKNVEEEQHRLEEQLRQAQKMEAIGRLAGGVAHDFNNLLAVILNYAEFLKQDLSDDHARSADVREISSAAQRGVRLVQQLLAFSRKQVVSPEALDLNEVLSSMEQLLRQAVRKDIQIPSHQVPIFGSSKPISAR